MKKHLELELKDIDEKGQVAFYFSKYDVKDSDGDIVVKGAFNKTRERIKRIKHFYNHNIYQVPGVLKEISEDETGAYAVSQLALKTELGRDVYEQYRAGIISEHSYGFDIMDSEPDNEKDATILKEIKLWEVSSLTAWGANEHTNVIDVKASKFLDQLLNVKEYDEKIVKQLKNIIDYLESLKAPDEGEEPSSIVEFRKLIKFL